MAPFGGRFSEPAWLYCGAVGSCLTFSNLSAPCLFSKQERYWDTNPGLRPPVNRPPFYLGKFKVSPEDWQGEAAPPAQPPSTPTTARPPRA